MAQRVEGKIVSIHSDGSLITDITADRLERAPRDERVTVRCDEHVTHGVFAPDHDQPDATFLAILRDDGLLMLTIVGESANLMLGLSLGDAVVVEW